jgi:uncharacterized protein
VLLQPRPVAEQRWWQAWVDLAATTADGAAPARPGQSGTAGMGTHPLQRLRPLAVARHAELQAAISGRRWFDPWVLDSVVDPVSSSENEPGEHDDLDDDGMPDTVHDTMYLWAAGFIEAMAQFDDLLELADPAAAEPQALICQFLDRDELEDADALWELVDTFEPPQTLAEAVECVVRATLLLADITQPRPPSPRGGQRPGTPISRGGSRRS